LKKKKIAFYIRVPIIKSGAAKDYREEKEIKEVEDTREEKQIKEEEK
jgi:hypothetical protein